MAEVEEKDYIVSFNGTGVTCKRPDGYEETVSWNDLEMVTIESAAHDADQPDVVWILWGKEKKSGVIFPGGATGAGALVTELQARLSPFRSEAITEAIKANENNTYLVWQRTDA